MHVSVYLGIESIAAFLDIRIHGRFSLGGAGPRTGRSGQHMPLSELGVEEYLLDSPAPPPAKAKPRFAASVAVERGRVRSSSDLVVAAPPHRLSFGSSYPTSVAPLPAASRSWSGPGNGPFGALGHG
jgi:hypothetical protein